MINIGIQYLMVLSYESQKGLYFDIRRHRFVTKQKENLS